MAPPPEAAIAPDKPAPASGTPASVPPRGRERAEVDAAAVAQVLAARGGEARLAVATQRLVGTHGGDRRLDVLVHEGLQLPAHRRARHRRRLHLARSRRRRRSADRSADSRRQPLFPAAVLRGDELQPEHRGPEGAHGEAHRSRVAWHGHHRVACSVLRVRLLRQVRTSEVIIT
eukprot:scaffold90407_cov55-Phaeocystis_antarctica.AAC.3